jgi:hypothetical protein
MSYNLLIPTHKIDSIFGSAFPSLPLRRDQKCLFLTHILVGKTGCAVPRRDLRPRELAISGNGNSYYDVDIYVDDTKGYNIAIAVEKWVDTVPNRKRRNLFQFLRRRKRGAPVDSYLIPTDNSFKVLTWLNEHCAVTDYQLYSKFGSDVSVGFKSTDHSTLFKLAFVGIDD